MRAGLWGELVQVHDDRAIFQASPVELPVIDAVSLLGLDMTEWRVKAVRTQNSGDDGGARISIDRRVYVDLRGYWDSVFDEVNLNSLDMPAPPRRGTTSAWHVYVGTLSRGPALVYSTIAD